MLPEIHNVYNWLISFNKLKVPIDWLEACVSWVKSEYQNESLTLDAIGKHVFDQWLASDLHEIGFSCLPADILSVKKIILNDTYYLQINSIYDISKSLYSQIQKLTGKENDNVNVAATTQNWKKEIKSSRMLMLKLTDGNVEISAMEFKFIPALNENINPGTKVIVKNGVICRNGTLLLSPDNICVLGGVVDKLIEDYDYHLALRAIMQKNIENSNKFSKYLPHKTFESQIISKIKSDIKPKIDFDDDDDDMLIYADGLTIQNKEACKPLYHRNLNVNEFSLKRPRIDYDNEIKYNTNNIDFENHGDINFCSDYHNNAFDQSIKPEINEDILSNINNSTPEKFSNAKKCTIPTINIHHEAENDINFLYDIDDNDFTSNSATTTLNPINQNNKLMNNNCHSTDDIFFMNNLMDENFMRPANSSTIKNNVTFNTLPKNSSNNFVNGIEENKFNIYSLKDEHTNSQLFVDSSLNTDDIVNDTANIIDTQNNYSNLITKLNDYTNNCSKENIYNTHPDLYNKCVNLFRDDEEDISILKYTNKDYKTTYNDKQTDNIHNISNDEFKKKLISEDSVLVDEANNSNEDQAETNEISLYEPFTYISIIQRNNLLGTFSIKAYVVTILGSLSHNLGKYWDLTVKINDGSATLDVQLSDDVIKNIVGISAKECHEIKLLAAKDIDARSRLIESLNKLKENLINLSAILTIKFEVESFPFVTNIRSITYDDIQLLKNRINSFKSKS